MTDETDFEALWNAVPLPALLLDGEARVTAANAAAEQFLSLSRRALRERGLDAWAPEGSRLAALLSQARETGVSLAERDLELAFGEEGTAQVVDVNITAMNDAPRSSSLLVLLQPRGIVERMTRSLAHRGAARSVSGMASTLAHEIKNPLAAISGAAQLLQMTVPDSEAELTRLIHEESARIQRLVDRVELFTDERPVARRPVNLHDALRKTRRAAEAGFGNGVRFVEEYDPSLPPVSGDADMLTQAFQNLVKNAAEAAGEGGVITLRTAYRPGVRLAKGKGERLSLPLEVAISNTGRGVPEELAPFIFEPFVTTKSGGQGLGLAVVSKVVSDLGGMVECEGGAGRTTFRMRLPVWEGAEEAATEAPARTPEFAA